MSKEGWGKWGTWEEAEALGDDSLFEEWAPEDWTEALEAERDDLLEGFLSPEQFKALGSERSFYSFHEVNLSLTLASSSPRNTEEIEALVLDYLSNELSGVYLLTEDEVDEVSFKEMEAAAQ